MTANSQDPLKSIIERIETAYQRFDKVYAGPEDERWLAWVHHLQELQESDTASDPSLWIKAAHNLILKEDKIKPEWMIARKCFEARDMLKLYLEDSNAREYLTKRQAYVNTEAPAPFARVPHEFVASDPYLYDIYRFLPNPGSVYNHVAGIDKKMSEYMTDPYGVELDFNIKEQWLFTQINNKLKEKGKEPLTSEEIKELKDSKDTSNTKIRAPKNPGSYLDKIKEKVKEKLHGTGGQNVDDTVLNEFFQGILTPHQDAWPVKIGDRTQEIDATKAYFKETYSCPGFDFNPPDLPQAVGSTPLIETMRQAAIEQMEEAAKENSKYEYQDLAPFLPPSDILEGVINKEQARKAIQMDKDSSYGKLITAIANPTANYPCLVIPPNFSLRKPSPHPTDSVGGQVLVEQSSSRILLAQELELELYSGTSEQSFKIKQDGDKISYFSDVPLIDPQATRVSGASSSAPSLESEEKLAMMYSMIQTALLNWKVGEAFSLDARDEEELRQILIILHESVLSYQKYDPKFREFPLDHVNVPHLLRPVKSEVLRFYQRDDLKKLRQDPERAPQEMSETLRFLQTKNPDPPSLQQKFDLGSEAIRAKLLASLHNSSKISAKWMKENAADLSKVPRYKEQLQKLASKSDGMFVKDKKRTEYFEKAQAILDPKPKS